MRSPYSSYWRGPNPPRNRKGERVTQDEMQVLSDLYIAHAADLVGAVKPEFAAEAERLTEQGWLERRFNGDDVVHGFTDTGLGALALAGLHRTNPADQN
jgi:hypothetical protein